MSADAIPPWTREIDRALATAMRDAPLLAAATPQGGLSRAELIAAFEAGAPRAPQWTYAPIDAPRASARATALTTLADALESRAPATLARAYAERARELAVESLLAADVGSATFAERARLRFAPEPAGGPTSALAAAWVAETEAAHSPDTSTDGPEPFSLASRLREEIGRHRLPFRVVVKEGLAPLAATGERTVWVAARRAISRVDVERTVLHEIEGHVLPRFRASALLPGIFAVGTARGADDQEGFALVLEERHDFLRGARRRELALRHRAIEAMDAGATFVDAVRTLIDRDGAAVSRAVVAAERAFRGSAGETPGLGRERIYLMAYTRVAARLAARPEDERVMASGQVAVEALDALRAFVI